MYVTKVICDACLGDMTNDVVSLKVRIEIDAFMTNSNSVELDRPNELKDICYDCASKLSLVKIIGEDREDG